MPGSLDAVGYDRKTSHVEKTRRSGGKNTRLVGN